MAVLRRVVAGAASLLREGGYLMAVTELANPAEAHTWLSREPCAAAANSVDREPPSSHAPNPAATATHQRILRPPRSCLHSPRANALWVARRPSTHGLEICVVFNPRHSQSAEEYAADRASERVGASATQWAAELGAHGVRSMGSGLVLAVQRARRDGGGPLAGCSVPIDAGEGSEDLPLFCRGREVLRAAQGALLGSAACEDGGDADDEPQDDADGFCHAERGITGDGQGGGGTSVAATSAAAASHGAVRGAWAAVDAQGRTLLAVGVRTADGLCLPLLLRGAALPARGATLLTTSADGRRSIRLQLLLGSRAAASA
eukprot:5690631-Prymnesium_polylepis.1